MKIGTEMRMKAILADSPMSQITKTAFSGGHSTTRLSSTQQFSQHYARPGELLGDGPISIALEKGRKYKGGTG